MMMVVNGECLHEDQLQDQSVKLERLEARVDFKHEKITEINDKMDKLSEKIDNLVNSMNELTLKSNNEDHLLDARLKAIETELALQKQVTQDNKDRTNQLLTIITIFFTALTIYLNYLR